LDVYPRFTYRRFHLEAALWDLIEKKPPHLLNSSFVTWDELLVAAADDVIEELDHKHISIEHATWGRANQAAIMHPFGKLNPLLAKWLSLPADELPGDYDTPRVQAPDDGASERFVVSPGHEEDGIFEMPGGQSGHPLSPYFRAGHEAWLRGDPTPFLPGKTEHTLIFTAAVK
jgi:penicillin amidase